MLHATDMTNILKLKPSFKLYQQFHQKVEEGEYDLKKIILGEQTISNPETTATYTIPILEEVLEKPELASTIGSQYKNLDPLDLADIMYC